MTLKEKFQGTPEKRRERETDSQTGQRERDRRPPLLAQLAASE